MRILFFGSGDFALPTLRALLRSEHEIAAVVTQPPRRAGRGGNLRATPVERFARAQDLEVFPSQDVNAETTLAYLRYKQADVICVVEFGQFLRESVRAMTPHGAINLHGSVLPRLRGAAPVHWAILRGMNTTGVTTFSLVDTMDAGPVYRTATLEIGPEERAGELRGRLATLGAATMLETLDALAGGKIRPRPQDDTQATFAPRLKKSDGFLDFRLPAEHVLWKIRGTWPWPGARAVFGRAGVQALPVTIARARRAEGPARCKAGRLDEDLCVSTSNGRLEIVEIQPAGKRVLAWRDFVNGYRIRPGDVLHLPESEDT